MFEITEFSYDEMVTSLNRKELIAIDTNVWLDLFVNYSCEEIVELFEVIRKEYFIHEVFVVPHINEEYINGKKKVKDTFKDYFRKNKGQLLKIYDEMKLRINNFDNSFYNCVGFQEIVDKSNLFYEDIKAMINSLVVGDTISFDDKEKIIDSFLDICNQNYSKVKMVNAATPLKENVWKSDSKKDKNSDGDFIIWNQILELSSNYKCKKIILVVNEKKNEWNDIRVEKSLKENSTASLEIIDFKTFVRRYLTSVSYSLFCKCVNNYDRYYQYTNINNYNSLSKKYRKLIEKFIPMDESSIIFETKELIEYDLRMQCLEENINDINIHILGIEPLSQETNVITTSYDEVRLDHKFNQKVKCIIEINNDRNKAFLFDNLSVEYNLISNRVLMGESQFLDEWISKNVDYDYDELKRNIGFIFKK